LKKVTYWPEEGCMPNDGRWQAIWLKVETWKARALCKKKNEIPAAMFKRGF